VSRDHGSLGAGAIIDAIGGTAAVARICKVNSQAVSQWRRNGIPRARLQLLEVLHPDIFAQVERLAA